MLSGGHRSCGAQFLQVGMLPTHQNEHQHEAPGSGVTSGCFQWDPFQTSPTHGQAGGRAIQQLCSFHHALLMMPLNGRFHAGASAMEQHAGCCWVHSTLHSIASSLWAWGPNAGPWSVHEYNIIGHRFLFQQRLLKNKNGFLLINTHLFVYYHFCHFKSVFI